MAIFGPKNRVFGQQNEICGQNATRDLFLYHQKGAACKIWANSDGSFSRSGVEWNKRLKLNFWYRTRAGGPTPPSKVRVDRWGRPPRRARLNRWLGDGRKVGLEITAVVLRRVVFWIHVVTTIEINFSSLEHISNKNASLQQHWHSKTLSASSVASLRAVDAETIFRSMCFSQVHSHLPDREDVNVLDCITLCDQFFRQNFFNSQTHA